MGGCLRVGLLRCGPFSLSLSPVFGYSALELWGRSGLSLGWHRYLCFYSMRHCLLLWLSCHLQGTVLCFLPEVGLSEVRGHRGRGLRLRCRVIVLTQCSTVWPKVLTGGSSVRSACGTVGNQMLMNWCRRRIHFTSWWRCCSPSHRMQIIRMETFGRCYLAILLLRFMRWLLSLWNKRKGCSRRP